MNRLLLTIIFFCSIKSLTAQDTLTFYCVYGSKPKAKGESSWFGGKLGGHIGLGINADTVFHFNPRGPVYALNRNSPLGVWRKNSAADFLCTFGCDSVKTLIVKIPVDHTKWVKVREKGLEFIKKSPYEYAFFGMRCTAACYHLLSIADVYPELSKRKMTNKFFYPRKLRRKLLEDPRNSGWIISREPGRTTRKWDHD